MKSPPIWTSEAVLNMRARTRLMFRIVPVLLFRLTPKAMPISTKDSWIRVRAGETQRSYIQITLTIRKVRC